LIERGFLLLRNGEEAHDRTLHRATGRQRCMKTNNNKNLASNKEAERGLGQKY
jgi:hypothetical protein